LRIRKAVAKIGMSLRDWIEDVRVEDEVMARGKGNAERMLKTMYRTEQSEGGSAKFAER
jgi:hypothetical protein